ncbi:MAG: META domain-containing protein [Hyphomonadaceae bacterium]|nr:META domain-containing protein [Hyphomonadaceae bacterium]
MRQLLPAMASVLALFACAHGDETLNGRWRVQQIAGASLGEGVDIWMTFDTKGGTVSGYTGCNDFAAPLDTFGEAVNLGPVSEGAGDCTSIAAATDERRLLMVLPLVQRRILRGRSLELLQAAAGGETLIRLRREEVDE